MKKPGGIASEFAIDGTVEAVAPFGAGLINDTWRVVTSGAGPGYVLQRVNHAVFRDVELLQRNIARVTDHIRARLVARGVGDVERRALRIVPERGGRLFHFDGESYWRMTVLIPGARSYARVTPELAEATGRAFGDFQSMLADLPGEPLGATIPNFHNMEFRLGQLGDAVAADRVGRVEEMRGVIGELMARSDEMCAPQRMVHQGRLPLRVTHCDTKVDNVLLDEETGEVLCVVDLDTTMPGLVMSDFGDFIRTAANTGAEDDRDPGRVGVDMEIFRAFARGYLQAAGEFLTPLERELLPMGARMLTYMQAVRFLTDYLDGDTYYKVRSAGHNRERTLAQLAMLKSIEAHGAEMERYVNSI